MAGANFSLCSKTTVFIFTGNIKLRGDGVEQQQAGPPRQSAATFQPRSDGIEHFLKAMFLQAVGQGLANELNTLIVE